MAAKLVSRLPERRANPAAGVDLNTGNLYVYGGQDVKVGLLKKLWKINLKNVIDLQGHMFEGETDEEEDNHKWEVVETTGPVPKPMSHAAGFCSKDTNRFFIFGGTTH